MWCLEVGLVVSFLFFNNNAWSLELMMLVAPLTFNMEPWCLSEPRIGFLHVVQVWSVSVHLTF